MQTLINKTLEQASWQAYLELCKPRVVVLMLVTAIVGMLLAATHYIPWNSIIFGTLGIALAAGAGATLNHVIDRRIDAMMARTSARPIPSGKISTGKAVGFALGLAVTGTAILVLFVNPLTAILTLVALIGYAIVYTVFLKRTTPQNIVIGGLAGAMPPLLGWTAVTGTFDYASVLLVLIIFTWTPPHFWALAIYRYEEYARTGIPMLPVTHGIAYTKLHILLYTFLTLAASVLPFVINMAGLFYLIGALLLGGGFLYWAIKLKYTDEPQVAIRLFKYSIFYLGMLFLVLLIDHYLR
jgi:protoheme IX farnesyltransferase